MRGIHRSPVNSPHKGQWRGALTFSLICAWIKDWVNNREAGDLTRHRAHYEAILMVSCKSEQIAVISHDWHSVSLASRLFHQHFVRTIIKEKSKIHYTGNSHHKRPVMWNTFPCHDVIMIFDLSTSTCLVFGVSEKTMPNGWTHAPYSNDTLHNRNGLTMLRATEWQ